MKIYKNVSVLLSLIFSFSICNTIYGATLNDIRQIYGRLRSDNSKFLLEAEKIEKDFQDVEDQNRYATYTLSMNLKEIYTDEYEQSKEIYDNKVKELDKAFTDNDSVQNLFSIYDQFDELESDYKLKLKKYENVKDVDTIENKFVDSKAYIDYIKGSSYDVDDYGDLGQYTRSIVEGQKEMDIRLPFGYYDDNGENKYNYGLYLNLNKSKDNTIISVLKGIVNNIYIDSNGQYVIEVNSGNYLKVTYWYIDEPLVAIGDSISQYDSIGIVHKKDKVYFDVLLDTEYVNPLTLYQEEGQKLYNWFMTDYPNVMTSTERVIFDDINYNDIVIDSTDDSTVDNNKLSDYNKSEYINELNESSGDTQVSRYLDLVPKEIRIQESLEAEEYEKSLETKTDGQGEANEETERAN